MNATIRRSLSLLAAAALAVPAAAADDAFEFYKEEAQFTTASRRPEPAWRAPAAVDVVTAQEIRAYGFRNLWDVLRWRAGLDVIEARSADGNRAIVSARGFSRDFVSEMQVLVDGRSVYSPFLGGVYWASMPVQMQDVERIEIVRGPNAALYGSNAALGVINIITRKPGGGREADVAARAGDRSAAAAAAGEAGGPRGALRLSYSYEREDGGVTPSGAEGADDFFRSNKVDARGRWSPDPATELELLAGGAWQTEGVPGFPQSPQAKIQEDFGMLRGSRRLEGAGTVEAMFSRADDGLVADPFFVGRAAVRTYQYDAEALHRFSWLDGRADSSWGAGWRLSVAESDQTFAGRPYAQNRLVRGFTHHSVRLSELVTAVAGASLEDSETGGFEPDWQAALLLSPREDQVFRLSYSQAATIPPLFNKSGDYQVAAGETIVGNPDLGPQHMSSWEAGWAGRALDGALKTDLTLYYMELRDRIFYDVLSAPPVVISYDNRNRALARGAEVFVRYALGPGREVFANYTFERITDSAGPTDAFRTDLRRVDPVHKANVGASARLGGGWRASAVLGYKDAYDAVSSTRGTRAAIPRAFRLDSRLAWSPARDWELFVAGHDLLQPYAREYADGIATPRSWEAGVTGRFAP